jgi:predicted unusual protein kinase regulating ubiquinone biosynthesis (AarF/ABC1/UbiB family)
MRFTWYNPERRQRERGVFKVMKPYVRDYFAEDMDLLARLAKDLGSKHHAYGFAEHTFHADPHAGNLLYNKQTGVLTLLDWALTGHITEEERRKAALLFLMLLLRDSQGICGVIESLSQGARKRSRRQPKVIREQVRKFFEERPLTRIPGAADVVDLLERIAWQGVRLPTHLVMLRKALFTLDGILHDIAGSGVNMELVMVQRLLQNWLANPIRIGWPLALGDWIELGLSTMLYGSRLVAGGVQLVAAAA